MPGGDRVRHDTTNGYRAGELQAVWVPAKPGCLSRRFDELGYAHGDGHYPQLMKKLAVTDVLVLDDWGLAKLTAPQRRDLLEVLDEHT